MTVDKLNNWLTLVANLAVLFGIGLVVLELQQNGEMMRSQTRSQISAEIIELLSDVASDPQLASLIRRADKGEELTPDEWSQYFHRTAAMFRSFENVHYQYRQGMYDETEYLAYQEAWRMFFQNSKSAVVLWCGFQPITSPEFRNAIDALIVGLNCLDE